MIDRARDSAIKASMDAFVTRAMMIDITKGNFLTAHCELGGDSEIQAICRSIEGNMPGGAGPIISIAADNYFCIQAPLNDGSHWKVNSRGEVGRGLCGYVGYWRFAGDAKDLSPHANHGTIMSGAHNCTEDPAPNCPTFGANGLNFDGVDDFVDARNDASLNITDAITVEAWIKPNTVLGLGTISEYLSSYIFRIEHSQLIVRLFVGGIWYDAVVALTNTNTWSHVIFKYDTAWAVKKLRYMLTEKKLLI